MKNINDLNQFYKKIYKLGFSRILVESGLTFLNTLLRYNSIHELYIFKSDKKIGKNGQNNDTNKYLKNIAPKLLTINLNGDKLFKKEFNYV